MTKVGVMTKVGCDDERGVMTAALRPKMITKADRCLPPPNAALKRSYFGADAPVWVILCNEFATFPQRSGKFLGA